MTTKSTMNFVFVVTPVFIFVVVAGLKCRVNHSEQTQDGFHDVVRACMNDNFRDEEMTRPYNNNNNYQDNNNNNNNWQGRPQWNHGIPRFPTKDSRDGIGKQEDSGDEEGSREPEYNRGNTHPGYHPRHRRAPPPRNFFTSRTNYTNTRRKNNASPLEEIEPCMIHCIFRQMQMLDDKDQPDRTSVVSVMTNKLRDPELKEFIRDSISECFDTLESESLKTKCSFSKSFAMCLEQKGQQNCEDWDDDMKKPNQKHSGMNINKHRG